MKMKPLAGALVLGLLLNAQASLIWSIAQVGDDVVVSTGGGSLDLTGLSNLGPLTLNSGGYTSFRGAWARFNTTDPNGGVSQSSTMWGGYICDDQLSSSVELTATSASGEIMFFQDNVLVLDATYISGEALGAASITFANTTLADMELESGDYATYTWDADSISVTVVPEPATAGLLGISVGALWLIRRLKKAANYYRT